MRSESSSSFMQSSVFIPLFCQVVFAASDKLQLTSTIATYTYFNPQTNEAKELRNRFIEQVRQNITPEAEMTHSGQVKYARNTGPTGSLRAVNKATKIHPQSTPPEAFHRPDTAKKSVTTSKRQLSFEEPGRISDTKKIRYPE